MGEGDKCCTALSVASRPEKCIKIVHLPFHILITGLSTPFFFLKKRAAFEKGEVVSQLKKKPYTVDRKREKSKRIIEICCA